MLLDSIIDFIYANRKNGRRGCFMWSNEGLDEYIKWAFSKNGLLLALKDNKINGVAVVYALPSKHNGTVAGLLPSDEPTNNPEHQSDLCVGDWIALDANGRKELISQFHQRFPNWENQNKYGIQFGKPKLLTNKYMNLLKGLN